MHSTLCRDWGQAALVLLAGPWNAHPPMDTVFINGLELRSVIGVHAWERVFAQRLRVDVRMQVDTYAAAQSDALGDAIDYAALSEQLIGVAKQADCQLIEALAARLMDTVMADLRIHHTTLTLHKPGALPGAQGVGVTLSRSQLEDS